MEEIGKIGIEDHNQFAKTWALFLNNMDLAHKNAWAPFSISPIRHYNCTWTFQVSSD